MANITPPKYVKHILTTLQSRGHLAYVVGGCVRDMIMDIQPQDWDICTSALPEQVMEIFPGSQPTGIKHGTITVIIGSHHSEVTTFRTEGEYSDHRRPDTVSFVCDLNTDLSRRDFTINAIAVSATGLISDPFDGIKDIENKIIRCVNEPELRFREDALRMFRAFRFSARLGFTIEENTLKAIEKNAPLAADLAAERVYDEVSKILLTKAPDTVGRLISPGLMDNYIDIPSPKGIDFSPLDSLSHKLITRWAGLCYLLLENNIIGEVYSFLLKLKADKNTIHHCVNACIILSQPRPEGDFQIKQLMNKYGVDTVVTAAQIDSVFNGGTWEERAKNILKSGECFTVAQLAISGEDLIALGFNGRVVGQILNFLLEYVMEYPANNQRDILLSIVTATEE